LALHRRRGWITIRREHQDGDMTPQRRVAGPRLIANLNSNSHMHPYVHAPGRIARRQRKGTAET